MVHKLLTGKGKMKKGLSLLLCLALLGSSVISLNVTAEAESEVTVETDDAAEAEETSEAVETLEMEKEIISDTAEEAMAASKKDALSEEETGAASELTEEITAEVEETVTQTPAEETVKEVIDTTSETSGTLTEDSPADTTVEQTAEETVSTIESTETISAENTETTSNVTAVKEGTEYTGTVTMNDSTLVTVKASAKANTFPEGTTMSVTLLDAGNENVEKALDESGVEYDGYVSLDISFCNMDETEVEPEDGSVSVKISMDVALLDEEIDEETLTVQHLVENEAGEIEVQPVADAAKETDGTVAVESGTVTAEFEAGSFSTYTFTWETSSTETKKVTIYFVDENGVDISGDLGIEEAIEKDLGNGENLTTHYGSSLTEIGTEKANNNYYFVTANLDSYDSGVTAADVSYNTTTDQYGTYTGWYYYYSVGWLKWTDKDGEQKKDDEVKVYLVYAKDYSESLTAVDTVDSDALGITIRMINYNSAANDISIGGEKYSDLNGGVKQGLVASKLEDGYPVTTGKYYGADGVELSSGTEKLSLKEAFSGGTNVNHLFLQSTYKETGYLEYSSFENYAYLEDSADFTVYEQIGTPSNIEAYFYQRGNFMPYNKITEGDYSTNTNLYDEDGDSLDSSDARYGEKLYMTQGTDYLFGMYLEATFYQPEGGKVDSAGEMVDMIYEFNGDDDLWVFIDDVLVLDIGGVSDAHSGYINFATGVVHVELGDIDGDGTDNVVNTTIIKMFEEASEPTDGFAGDTFADYTTHTIKMFYMERGEGASNLHIKMNLPTIEKGSIQITKELSNTDKEDYANVEFVFQVYLQEQIWWDENENQTYSNGYVQLTSELMESDGITIEKTDSSGNKTDITALSSATYNGETYPGVIYLKPGETVTISGLQENRSYYVSEVGVESEYYDRVTVNESAVYGFNENGEQIESIVGVAQSNETKVKDRYRVIFTNNCSAENSNELWITKVMENGQKPADESDTFSFKIQLENQNGYLENYVGEYYLVDADGNYYYYSEGVLKNNETAAVVCGTLTSTDDGIVSGVPVGYSVVITQILSGTSFYVAEVNLDTENYSESYSKSLANDSNYSYSTNNLAKSSDGLITADGEIALNYDAKVTITNSLEAVDMTVIEEVTNNMGDDSYKNPGETTEEAAPADPGEIDPAQTGDTANLALYAVIMLAAAAVIIFLVVYSKRKKAE